MRIGFTYDLKTDYQFRDDLPQDAFAELDYEEVIDEVVDAISAGGHEVVKIGNVRNLLERIKDLKVDIVFNLCEGLYTRNRESEVPVLLDIYRIPYVGSDGLTLSLTLDKAMAKKIFVADGVPTPKYFVADSADNINMKGLKFPMIVKPRQEGSSKGISQDSIVKNKKSLRLKVDEIVRVYKQPALVEEFISGSEFTVLVIGNENPKSFVPVQIGICGKAELGDLIYTSRRVTNDEIKYICPPKISSKLDKKMRDMAIKAYKALECKDFSRIDFRVDKKGNPYVLEINPLPSLSSEDVFPLIAAAEGLTYGKLILQVIDAALSRQNIRSN